MLSSFLRFTNSKISWGILLLAAATIGIILWWGISLPHGLALLSLPGRNSLESAGLQILDGLAGPLAFSALVALALHSPEKIRTACVTAVILAGFALALTELWSSGASTGPVVGGFLPNSDARGYVYEGTRLTEGNNFTGWGSRRPLAGAYMAAMLWLAQDHVRWAVALLAAFTGVTFSLLLIRIRTHFGTFAAGVATLVLFMFYRRYLGSSLSESCGITFGALGLALLLDGFARQRTPLVLLGTVCLCSGLNARAGAFFILPCLLLAILWHWRKNFRQAFLVAGLAGGCMVAAAVANVGTFKALGDKDGRMFSNLGLTLYGVIHGGDWTLAYQQHPELLKIPEGKQAMTVYKIVWEDVKKDPSLATKGAFRAWGDFFMNRNGPFVYVGQRGLERLLIGGAALGVVFAIVSMRRRSDSGLILSGVVGVALSLPFAPPWDADSMRAYAVTIPFFALISGSGATALITLGRWLRRRGAPPQTETGSTPESSSVCLVTTAGALLCCLYILPALVRYALPHAPPTVLHRPDGYAELTITLKSGNILRVVPDDAARTYLPDVRVSDLLQRLGYYGAMWHQQADYLRQLAPYHPIFIIPGSTGMGFLVVRDRTVHSGERVKFRGKVHAVVDGDFFVEDGLPAPGN